MVKGTEYTADFTGHVGFLLDPAELARFENGEVANGVTMVNLLIQEDVANGIGALIGPITIAMDLTVFRHPAPSSP